MIVQTKRDQKSIEEGNYTSKVSWHQMKSIGIKYSIIGHNERKDNLNVYKAKTKIDLINKKDNV